MLTSVDVKFISVVHLYRKVKEIKFCSGQQIYSKYQMSSIAHRVVLAGNLAALLTSLVHYDKILSKFGQR